MGLTARQLEELVEHPIKLEAPDVIFVEKSFADYIRDNQSFDSEIILLSQGFQGELFGVAHILFPKDASLSILNLMYDEEGDGGFNQINEMTKDGLQEIANTLINACIGSISNVLQLRLKYLPPEFTHIVKNKGVMDEAVYNVIQSLDQETLKSETPKYTIVVSTNFSIRGKDIDGSFLISMNIAAIKSFIKLLDAYVEGVLA